MVTVSQQTRIPILKADSTLNTGKEKTVGADRFMSFLDKSLSKPLHALKDSVKAGESVTKPMQSNRSMAKEDGAGTRIKPSAGNVGIRSEQAEEIQPEAEPIQESTESAAVMKPDTKAVDDAAEEKTEEKQVKSADNSESSPTAIELTQQCDQLLSKMDEIIQVLQQAAAPAQAPKEGNSAETVNFSSKPATAALHDELQGLLSDLVKTAEQLEGTKTAGHALAFANKLQQLLGEDSFEALVRNGLEISVGKGNGLQELAGKMLFEAENAKMHLVQTSLQEITIPALKAAAPKAPSTEVPAENEETAAQAPVQEAKTLKPEVAENRTSSEQTEDKLQEKAHIAQIPGKKTENVAELKPQALADAAPGLKEPQKEAIIAEPVRTQTYSKAEVTEQIVEKAETMIREDKSEMVMQLRPESLGKISLRVIHERGEIIARFVAESEQVKAILEGNMQLLKDSLQKSGVMVQSLEVSVGQQGREQQRGWNDRQKEGFSQEELKVPNRPHKNLVQPVYGYGGSTSGYYSAETSEIDLTA